MTTYQIFLRNGESLKINADGYNRVRGTFHVSTEDEEGNKKTRIIADFEPREILGVVEDDSVID